MALFAPYIDNKLPAFYGETLIIPFRLNKAVGEVDIKGLRLKVKYATTNGEKCLLKAVSWWRTSAQTYEAQFLMEEDANNPEVGMYYKVQMCFIDADGVDGYYSTVGIIKKTQRPQVTILNRENNVVQNTYDYMGFYSNEDSSEKVATYCFNLYDETNKIIASSGELIHSREKDIDSYSSSDSWTLTKNLEPNINYELEYVIYTINGLRQASRRYSVIEAETVAPNIHATFIAQKDFDNGIVSLFLKGNYDKVAVSGSFIVLRSSELDNFETWDELTRFYLVGWKPNELKLICKDYTCQQGIKYKYALQAYNSKGLYSDKMLVEGETVTIDFEDSFLYDGEKQLKIRFNPKVSSFKNTILETKTDTIGGKHPFFFRNGNVKYKEFPISGLLTLVSDENQEFSPLGNGINADTIQLTQENYCQERSFKLEALDWLSNGKPKLFRSPAEGNYIVRLMNVSLSPLDNIGRMLHTFNSNAYEIADCSFENLKHYGLITSPYVEQRELKINQIDLNAVPADMLDESGAIILPRACFAQISTEPNIDFEYLLANEEGWQKGSTSLTGTFIFPETVLLESPLVSIRLSSASWGSIARLTYGYYDMKNIDNFSYISKIDISDNILQILGKGISYNIIERLEDIRKKTGVFHYIRAQRRDIKTVYKKGNDFYLDSFMQYSKIEDDEWNLQTIYYDINSNTYYDGGPDNQLAQAPNFMLYINDQELDLGGTGSSYGRYEALTNIGKVERLNAGEGIILDIVYQLKEISYTIEEEDPDLRYLKAAWELSKKQSLENPADDELKAKEIQTYIRYVDLLTQKLNSLKEEYSIEFAI